MAADPNYASVSLLLHADGSNGSTTFTDNGPLGLLPSTVGGTICISTAQSKWGGASLDNLRKGELIYNSSGFSFGNGDFTIEGWAWWNTASGSQQWGLLQVSTPGGYATSSGISLYAGATGKWAIFGYAESTLTITTGVWHHFAIVRSGTTLKLYVNGVAVFSTTNSTNYTGTYAVIGGYYSTAYRSDAYLDDIRVTKGVARYTADFTPPAEAFGNYANYISGVIRDDSGVPCARTVRAYDRATGALLSSTTSDAGTGAYTLATGVGEVQRVVLDDAGGTLYNDLIDRVIPE